MAKEEDDDASLEAVETDISSLKKEVEHLEFQRMFNQEHDEANCFLEIQPRRRNRSAGLGQHA